MDKILTLVFGLFITFSLSAGKGNKNASIVDTLPWDSTLSKVRLHDTISISAIHAGDSIMDTVPRAEIYQRAKNWFQTHFANPRKVIQLEAGPDSIMGEHRWRIYFINPKSGLKNIIKHFIIYDIKIECFAGYYVYTIDNLIIEQHSGKPVPVEQDWIGKDGHPIKDYVMYTNQLAEYLRTINEDIKAKMKLTGGK